MSPAAARSIVTDRYARVAPDVRLHYASCGGERAPLVLFLHGFPEFWFAWRELLPAFGDRYFAVAPDLRGYNRSDKPAEVRAYRASALVADVDALIAALGHERCAIVAHDWGGAVAWAYAIAHPQRVSKLVILNAPHPVAFARALANDPQQQAASAYMNWLRRPGSEGVLARDDFARLDRMFSAMGDASWYAPAVREAYHDAWRRPGALAAAVNWYRASPLHPPGADGAGAAAIVLDESKFVVHVPTLVVWGDADRALLPGLLDGLDRLVPAMRIVRLAHASHWLVHEEPGRVTREIAGFLADAA